jgi:hypothetical protein
MTRQAAPFTAAWLCVLMLAACASGPSGSGSLRSPPNNLPPAALGAADALLGGGGFSAQQSPDLDWGDGVLRPGGGEGFERIELPLFDGPGGSHWGWITQGRVYDQREQQTLPNRSEAAVEAAGVRSFLVLDQTEDGWMQIRYGNPEDEGGGLAWTRPDMADGVSASYVSWARLLGDARGLVYRDRTAAHNLRAEPNSSAEVVTRLEGENFDMAALEIRGDWMRVRVTSPPECARTVAEDLLLGAGSKQVYTGWIAWRSADRGPWIESAAGPDCGDGA